MPKTIPRKKLIKKLRDFGFVEPYSGGKHQFMVKGELKLRLPNPHQKDISTPLVKEILKQAGLSFKDWDN